MSTDHNQDNQDSGREKSDGELQTGNLKHAVKKGLPPGVSKRDFFDPGTKNEDDTGGGPAGRDDTLDIEPRAQDKPPQHRTGKAGRP